MRLLRSFCTGSPVCGFFVTFHKLFAGQIKQVNVDLVPEVLIRKFIDNICFSDLSGTIHFQGAVDGIVFPIQKLIVNFSFQIHGKCSFLSTVPIISKYEWII